MPNYDGSSGHAGNQNPNTDTRFGGKNAPPQSQDLGQNAKPWSIRHSLKHFAMPNMTAEEILEMPENELVLKILGKPKATPAEIGAARQMARYLQSCTDAQFLTDQIDGKLAQTNINADFAAIQNMSEEQLDEIIQQELKPGAGKQATDRGGDNGEEAPGGDQASAPEAAPEQGQA